jgi:hypothetical protein
VYQQWDQSNEGEFEHFLAEKLSMTVHRMRQEMPASEYLRWSVYYARKAQRQELEAKRRAS